MIVDTRETLPDSVQLVLFRVGTRLCAADASQVLRVGRPEEGAQAMGVLGALEQGERTLVFRSGEGEGELKVDAVHGLRRAGVAQLRRLPAPVQASPGILGFWLDGDEPVLLVDLSPNLFAQSERG